MKEYKCLDKGYVKVLGVFGSDHTIASCARVSFNKDDFEQVDLDRDQKLIDYLIENDHTSPFEMAELQFEIKCPLFVARQWFRHRTGNYSEVSGRYSEMNEEFYVPDPSRVKGQNKINKQSSSEPLDSAVQDHSVFLIQQAENKCYDVYKELLNYGVSRELARIVLPQSTYTRFVFKSDLHNLLHFIKLRSSAHAQEEIRMYSDIIQQVVEEYFPLVWQAFKKHKLA